MQCLPKHRILEHPPDTLITVRKDFDMDKPGAMEDAIRILREWVEKQPHFKKKDFSDHFLETSILVCKGSLERAKKQIDRLCTLITLLPQYFVVYNPKTDFGILFDVLTPVMIPKLTPDYYRVFILKSNNNIHLLKDYLDYIIYGIMIAAHVKVHDCCRGFILILDLMEVNVMDLLSKLDMVQSRQNFTILIEGLGMRVKGMHVYSPSKMIEAFVTILKQVVSPKVSDRIHSHSTLENISEIVPQDILPIDYGGKERSMKTLHDEWLDVLSSEENLNYLKDLSQAGTDETCRQTDKFNEEYAGMPGTFRVLSVD